MIFKDSFIGIFIKCFWNSDLGHENSVSTNYDWYASNADRFSKDEFLKFVKNAGLKRKLLSFRGSML